MKYALTQFCILILSVIILIYFFSLEYFVPLSSGNINWYNLGAVLFCIFFFFESFVSLVFFLVEKFLTCGIKEFPDHFRSLKWGISIAFCIIISILLSIFNIIPLFYAFLISVIILIIFNLFRVF